MIDLRAEYVKEAVAEDNAGNYQTAFEKYKIALEYFGTHLKYEKNARARETITVKVGLPCKRTMSELAEFLYVMQ